MVTVTFPSRPQIAPQPEPPARAAPDPGIRAFREVFDLLQPEGSAPAVPSPQEAPPSQDRTDDPADPPTDEPEQSLAGDPSPDLTKEATIAGHQPAPTSEPILERVVTEEVPSEGDKEPPLLAPLAPGVPVLQALMILTAAPPDAPADPAALPAGDRTVPAPAIPLAQGIALVPAAGIAQPPSLANAAVSPVGKLTSPAPVPTDSTVEEPELFILAEPAAASERKPGLATGVPPFWAAREAADPDSAAPEGSDSAKEDRLTANSTTPRPVVERRMDPAAAQSVAEPAMSFDGEEPSPLREAKPGQAPTPLQAIVGGPTQAALSPTSFQAPASGTLPPHLPAQIAAALAARPERPLELRLAPVELGGLTVNLRQDGEILRVVVQADRPETLDLLRRNGEILLEELRLAGFSGAALSFADGGGAQDRRASALSRDAPVTELPTQLSAAATPTARPAQTAQGLDLRL